MENTELPIEIVRHLDTIAERLWTKPSKACVLVGAGFSLNAEKVDESVSTPPLWNQLSDKLLEKLHGKDITGESKDYLNPLNIADELQSEQGHGEVDRLIEHLIPDRGLMPSNLHRELLRLPWTDVFTTNYDTLLERAADDVVERYYERVTNKDKLIHSHSPRIIKLHGSFPDNPPYIISSEDYRRYPIDNAILVNTVQQSLIENTLCLIGFSGDDPNFLSWIGWIRDNLGADMPKIYLIGVLNLTASKRSWFQSKNIIPIDISSISDGGNDVYGGLLKVIKYLSEKNEKPEEWGLKELNTSFKTKNDVLHFLKQLQDARDTYPGWKILPHSIRNGIFSKILFVELPQAMTLIDDSQRVALLYEYDWMRDKLLLPLAIHDIELYENILSSCSIMDNHIVILKISLMRAYRELGKKELWERVHNEIKNIITEKEYEELNRYCYEECLFYISIGDFENFNKTIKCWGEKGQPPYWLAKRASLIAEFISVHEGEKMLEDALHAIRRTINLVPISNKYEAISTESLILTLLKRVHFCSQLQNISSKPIEFGNRELYERMKVLSVYKCNPEDELNYFELSIRPYQNEPEEHEIPTFDLGRQSTSSEWKKVDDVILRAWQYARMLEEMAMPMTLPGLNTINAQVCELAVSTISLSKPMWAGAMLLRVGNVKQVSSLYSRLMISGMTSDDVNRHIGIYMSIFKQIVENSNNKTGTFYWDTVKKIIPEILSRLVYKASYSKRIELLSIIETLYKNHCTMRFAKMQDLARRLMESFSDEEQKNLFVRLFNMDIPLAIDAYKEEELDLLYYYRDFKDESRKDINENKVNELIQRLLGNEVERKVAIVRLYLAYMSNSLQKKQVEAFGNNLWAIVDENGFPKDFPYYKFMVLNLPHPNHVDPISILRNWMDNSSFNPDEANGVSIIHGKPDLWINILRTNQFLSYQWGTESLDHLCDEILSLVNKYSDYLANNSDDLSFASIWSEYKSRINTLANLIVDVIKPNIDKLSKDKIDKVNLAMSRIKDNIEELVVDVKLSDDVILPSTIRDAIIERLGSLRNEEVFDACSAIFISYSKHTIDENCVRCMLDGFRFVNDNRSIYMLQSIDGLIQEGYEFDLEGVQSILQGLKTQYTSTQIDEINDNLLQVEGKLYRQKWCVHLVNTLIERKIVNSGDDAIAPWIKLAVDPNEFWDIRNELKFKIAN